MIGSIYVLRVPTFSRTLVANEVLIRLSAPSTGTLFVHRAWWGQRGTDGLNEPSAINFVQLSTDGAGGGIPVFEPKMSDWAAFGGTAACIDADGWTTQPTVGDALDPLLGNWANGFEWAAHSVPDCIIIAPSARIGLRVLDASSAALQQEGGMAFGYAGS